MKKNKILGKKYFLISVILLSFFFFGGNSQAATINFSKETIKVEAGKTFKVNLVVNPEGVKNYTVESIVKFPPDLISVKTWKFTDDWMPLRQSGYDELDNRTGVFTRTAGFPGGFDTKTIFGAVTFLAKKTGTAMIQIGSNSMVLDANNNNLFNTNLPLEVNILNSVVSSITSLKNDSMETELLAPVIEEDVGIINPEELFDIRLNLQNNLLTKASELIALVRFESFGNVPTAVDLTYRILDSLNKEVYLEKGNIIVETEQLLIKEFKNLDLNSGKYTLILTTTYGNNITDEFRQGFEVGEVSSTIKDKFPFGWLLLTLGIVGLIIYLIYKRKRN